jgi:citrate lyase beta subunit
MSNLQYIYQYISLNQEDQKILQNLKKCPRACVVPILDVEDSLQIPLDPERTAYLKHQARITLRNVLSMARSLGLKSGISLRINAFETPEFPNDREMLHDLRNDIRWGSLFLPKVHSAETLQNYLDALEGIGYEELVVMAETQAFFNNQQAILQLCKKNGIKKVHFGHWDYFYDIRQFPIPLPDDESLWHRITPLIGDLEKAGMTYIHTPFCFLLQHDRLKAIASRLEQLSTAPFGMTMLSFSQAQAVCRMDDDVRPIETLTYTYDQNEKEEMARGLVRFFTRPVSPEFSFNIDTESYHFYAPHEYLNALDYLQRIHGENS